ncbi:MAG: Hsp20/alpha crystallin family protein [Peptococcaceae bacterium]|nr:Hsp20/alpha crystallin family protein [Peptococcaceae bacterium]
MYVSSINPSQVVAANQGYQTGATAFPVSIRPGLQGNTVTYAFNPFFSQSAAWGINPAMAGAAANPMLNQSLAMSWNPMIAGTGINPWNSVLTGTAMNVLNPALSTALAQTILPGSGISAWSPMINPVQSAAAMGFNTIQATSGLAQMRVDLHETNSDVVVAAELPNVSLNDLNLTVTDDSLSISATAFAGNRATSLFRTVALPTSIKSEQVEATYANGILEIRAPKSDVVTRRKVKVNLA